MVYFLLIVDSKSETLCLLYGSLKCLDNPFLIMVVTSNVRFHANVVLDMNICDHLGFLSVQYLLHVHIVRSTC